MVAHENVFKGAKMGGLTTKEELTNAMAAIIPNHITNDDVIFLCIGTDRSTGDALGPLVGTYLSGIGYNNVVGTVDNPTHAENLAERLSKLPAGKIVIAIDATLGQASSVGTTSVHAGYIKPGAGVGKDLPAAGDYSITACVNVGGFMEYFVLQNTRLSVVIRLAKDITSAIVNTFSVDGSKRVVAIEPTIPVKRKRGRPRKVAVGAGTI